MKSKWECPFERVREYPDCFQDCPDISACEMNVTHYPPISRKKKGEVKQMVRKMTDETNLPAVKTTLSLRSI